MDPHSSRNRLLDSSLNRAAEGLRVAEDICRFHWNLAGFAKELKELRHELLGVGRATLKIHRELLRARDIDGDVGRESGVAGTTGRPTPTGSDDALPNVAFSNLERVREALRTLEEITRDEARDVAGRFESIRYRLYGLEKGLARWSERRDKAPQLEASRLYLLATEGLCHGPLVETVGAALEAGVDIVQMREKTLSDRELIQRGRLLREVTARQGALFLVNDRPDVALLCQADGVHLGQDDLTVAQARSLLGEDRLIGVSTHSVEQARGAVNAGADYIGVGPMFPTQTKNAGPIFGPEGLRSVLSEVCLPAFAIGGIDEQSLCGILEAGGTRVAISSAILSSPNVREAVKTLRAALER